ncbi:hypothetical protein [Shewanella marina]|uniref:hypothetical protein n=1 Tax=Shewanella marina TaxID=487319 RepID=UPI000471BF2A|nr:hypothetical protein [Shewanella marina]
MRYKLLKANILMIAACYSSFSLSSPYPYDDESLLQAVKSAYSKYETKTGFCREMRKRDVSEVNSKWLAEQPIKIQKLALVIVGRIVFDRCVTPEKQNYLLVVMDYTSQTGDMTYMNESLTLNKSFYFPQTTDDLKNIPEHEIKVLTELPELYYPFDHFQVVDIVTKDPSVK